MDKRKISNITSYFQVVKSTANVSADSEQTLGENIVVNKFPERFEFQINLFIQMTHMCFLKGCLESKINFVIQNGLNCTHGLTMMK